MTLKCIQFMQNGKYKYGIYSFLKKQQSFCAPPGGKEVVENEKKYVKNIEKVFIQ
jgi:hypothetical protein